MQHLEIVLIFDALSKAPRVSARLCWASAVGSVRVSRQFSKGENEPLNFSSNSETNVRFSDNPKQVNWRFKTFLVNLPDNDRFFRSSDESEA